MKQNSNVPAFLTKLWTLVEDADTNEFICWSQEGNSFLVLDEQRFAKEILPKFFKHNNMASFIRQLNMYGFRKVLHIDTGLVKQERDGPVEFQHPYFKHGQDDLLENIKRKVSNGRPEDHKIRQEDLTKILAGVQSVHSKQENINVRLGTLKRENEALWREISDLRQKHSHQQQLIKKLIHFLITLAQSNRILNLKRKRSILMDSEKKAKYIHEIYDDPVRVEQTSVSSLHQVKRSDDDVTVYDLTKNDEDASSEMESSQDSDIEIVEVEMNSSGDLPAQMEVSSTCKEDVQQVEGGAAAVKQRSSSALQLNAPSALRAEDPVKMMDSMMNENGAISQNISLLGKVELMDYLDSIDCSLEDFQAMLFEKQHGLDYEAAEESVSRKENITRLTKARPEQDDGTDKQLIQYTSSPLLAFLDGCVPPSEVELSTASPADTGCSRPQLSSSSGTSAAAEPPICLLDASLEPHVPPRSSLIRLEPLTEEEASEETLFYLCELSPAEPNPTQLSGV
ncbi:heat shock factor protein 2 [Cyprinodon tularosa]|uniref:heat shock factor protein 2 n=1 Tax=Cyprinodon tularosa TaxID=77115 RepID=UPI0018E1F056|nr:heat shock factor protein 2 [Cyprinodon tularosa]